MSTPDPAAAAAEREASAAAAVPAGIKQAKRGSGMTTTQGTGFTWSGRHGRGAMKSHREDKHEAAVWRNSRTPPERRSRKRNRRNESREEGH